MVPQFLAASLVDRGVHCRPARPRRLGLLRLDARRPRIWPALDTSQWAPEWPLFVRRRRRRRWRVYRSLLPRRMRNPGVARVPFVHSGSTAHSPRSDRGRRVGLLSGSTCGHRRL